MTRTKIEKLKAIKEEFARTQARLVAARRLEESAEANKMSALLENDLEQAELVLAAQDIMHKLQNMAEDLAKMNAQDLFPLVDKMKASFGQEAAHSFEETAQEAISGAMNTVRHAKDELGNSIMRLEGKLPASDMASDANMDTGAQMYDAPEADQGGDVDAAMDGFGGADAASGPEEEPLGRARRESIESPRSALSESVILEAAGRSLLETEGLESLITWVLSEAAAGMPEDHFRSFATKVATRAATEPAKLAGWIGKKKLGMAAMAQLAEPTYTYDNQPELELVEGKTFKNSDDEDDNWKKKHSDKARQNARQNKSEKFDEGKTFKNNDDGDDNWDKKHSDKARQSARKNKSKKFEESALAAKAVAQLIEASIAREGKGHAAKAVREAAAYLAGQNLVEGEQDSEALVVEAFQEAYGMKPAAYSVAKLKEFMAPMGTTAPKPGAPAKPGQAPKAPGVPLSGTEKQAAAGAMAKIAGTMASNGNAKNQSVQSAMSNMTGQEKSVANKMLTKLKQSGQNPKNVGDFAAQVGSMVDGDDTNESKGENRQFNRRNVRKAINRSEDPSSKMAHGYGGSMKFASTKGEEDLDENINAAHWPVDSMGQYKGEPFQTDYNKLKPNPKGAAKSEGGAPETKVEEPKVDGVKAPEAKASEGDTPKTPKTKTEKSSGKPWEKAEETKEEASEDSGK